MAPTCVRGGFSREAKLLLNKYAKINISAKFDAFISDINDWHIFNPNSSDQMEKLSN